MEINNDLRETPVVKVIEYQSMSNSSAVRFGTGKPFRTIFIHFFFKSGHLSSLTPYLCIQ